jgi:prolipoprotein diacylglyceryltransferase
VPLQALALAAVIGAALAWFAGRVRHAERAAFTEIAFIVLAAIPGAVVGGRLVHGLVFSAAYGPEPMALLDMGRGSLSLAGAVVGGAVTAGYVCRQLGFRMAAWADAAALPLLLAIGGGKVAMLLGGAGQGLPWDGRGGVAFLGEGPWASLDPAVPAYPTQLLEGAWALLGLPILALVERHRRPAPGVVALSGVAWWLAGRVAVAIWWRDEPVLGPWGAEAVVGMVLLGGTIALIAARNRSHATLRRPHASVDSWMT